MRAKCLAQEHNTMSRPGLEPSSFDPDSGRLTTRPPRLPLHGLVGWDKKTNVISECRSIVSITSIWVARLASLRGHTLG